MQTLKGKWFMWYAKLSVSRDRARCIAAYGGKCSCCGEIRDSFLQIDHMNNDGNVHRRVSEVRRKGIFKWLILYDFPAGFQILCANCNHSKRVLHGICEHELDKPLYIEGLLVPVDGEE